MLRFIQLSKNGLYINVDEIESFHETVIEGEPKVYIFLKSSPEDVWRYEGSLSRFMLAMVEITNANFYVNPYKPYTDKEVQ